MTTIEPTTVPNLATISIGVDHRVCQDPVLVISSLISILVSFGGCRRYFMQLRGCSPCHMNTFYLRIQVLIVSSQHNHQ